MTVDVQDNFCLEEVRVSINGTETVYTEKELSEAGRITLWVGSADYWQELRVMARDGAGNVEQTKSIRFLITPNVLVLFLLDKRRIYGVIGLVVAVGIGLWRLFVARRDFRNR